MSIESEADKILDHWEKLIHEGRRDQTRRQARRVVMAYLGGSDIHLTMPQLMHAIEVYNSELQDHKMPLGAHKFFMDRDLLLERIKAEPRPRRNELQWGLSKPGDFPMERPATQEEKDEFMREWRGRK